MKIQIQFHSNADKRVFVKNNSFGNNEIISETPASITIKDEGYKFENNVHVYAVKVVEE
jgi:hypothetical protein